MKSHYPDENEQSYCSRDRVTEVFVLPEPRATTVNCPMIGGDRLFTRPWWIQDIRKPDDPWRKQHCTPLRRVIRSVDPVLGQPPEG